MTTQTTQAMSVADVALKYPNALKVFNRYHVDYCCGGNQPLEEACKRAGADYETIWREITEADSTIKGPDFNRWSPSLLVDYILEHHHVYVKEAIPLLGELLDKLCDVHGRNHPELFDIRKKFTLLSDELIQHMHKEERVLFPAIKAGASAQLPLDGPLRVMMNEHEAAGNLIKEIRGLTGNFTLPDDVCTTYRLTFRKLEDFDNDLMQHVHLENNILFRKVSPN